MITYYSVFLLLTTIRTGVRCQYLLKEYAPDHGNYEPATYSFAYGVSDPISGDHKHQWERMEKGHVHGEYGFMEPDGLMRLVQYKAGPKDGFQATVSKLAVQLDRPKFTHGTELYGKTGENDYNEVRYAGNDHPHILPVNQNKKNIIGIIKPEIAQFHQPINKPNKLEIDYVNEESKQHSVISPPVSYSNILNRRKKDQTSSNKRRQIVKKNNNAEMHFVQPEFIENMEYITNFNLNPVSIDQLNIPDGEKKILHELSFGEAQPLIRENIPIIFESQRISAPVQNPRPLTHNVQPPIIHPALLKFQKDIGNSQMFGYQVGTPVQIPQPKLIQNPVVLNYQNNGRQTVEYVSPLNQTNLDKLQRPVQALPTSIQDVKKLQGIDNYEDKRFQGALETIHSHPEVKLRLDNLEKYPGYKTEEQNDESPKIVNNYNQQFNNNPQQIYQSNENDDPYKQNMYKAVYEKTNLSKQNQYPIILLDPDAKFGLPFYPSSQELHSVPNEEYNYEDIPQYGPNLEGKRYQNENQTVEQKLEERQYLLGLRPGPLFPPPKGYTRETIWQAGDPDAAPQPEELVIQLNETCAYIQFNETTKGDEDGSRYNIWNAGDYSAQRDDEELIRSVNITCENYTTDALSNFSSGYKVVDYCWQCVKNNENEENQSTYEKNEENFQQQPIYVTSQIPEDNYENGDNYYETGHGPMKVPLYPNLGYRNDPEIVANGQFKRSPQKQKVNNSFDNKNT